MTPMTRLDRAEKAMRKLMSRGRRPAKAKAKDRRTVTRMETGPAAALRATLRGRRPERGPRGQVRAKALRRALRAKTRLLAALGQSPAILIPLDPSLLNPER